MGVAERLAKARKALDDGQISAAWELAEPLVGDDSLDEAEAYRLNFLRLACALYYTGDLDAANELNATMPITANDVPMRYRLAIRQRQPKTARWLRKSEAAAGVENIVDDFKCSVGLYCLWHKRYRAGFAFYKSRTKALMFPQVVPKSMKSVPLPDDPKEDEPLIILEQGVGDVILYLSLIHI